VRLHELAIYWKASSRRSLAACPMPGLPASGWRSAPLSGVVADSVRFCFDLVAEGTNLERRPAGDHRAARPVQLPGLRQSTSSPMARLPCARAAAPRSQCWPDRTSRSRQSRSAKAFPYLLSGMRYVRDMRFALRAGVVRLLVAEHDRRPGDGFRQRKRLWPSGPSPRGPTTLTGQSTAHGDHQHPMPETADGERRRGGRALSSCSRRVLAKNDEIARREPRVAERGGGILAVNLMSSPGAGKDHFAGGHHARAWPAGCRSRSSRVTRRTALDRQPHPGRGPPVSCRFNTGVGLSPGTPIYGVPRAALPGAGQRVDRDDRERREPGLPGPVRPRRAGPRRARLRDRGRRQAA